MPACIGVCRGGSRVLLGRDLSDASMHWGVCGGSRVLLGRDLSDASMHWGV